MQRCEQVTIGLEALSAALPELEHAPVQVLASQGRLA